MVVRVNRAAVLAIAGRDLRIVVRSRVVLIPLLLVPLVLLLAPPLTLLAARSAPESLVSALAPLIARLPLELVDRLPGQADRQAVVVLLIYVFAPLYLLVPVMVATVTAAESVAGERERGTLESLLHSPTTDGELLLGKLLTPWVIATAVALIAAAAYGVVANLVLTQYGLSRLFPNVEWLVLVAWVAPAAAGFGLCLIVAAANRVKTTQEANQIAGVVVLPISALVVAQAAGLVLFGVGLLALTGVFFWVFTFLLFRSARRNFRRDRLLARD